MYVLLGADYRGEVGQGRQRSGRGLGMDQGNGIYFGAIEKLNQVLRFQRTAGVNHDPDHVLATGLGDLGKLLRGFEAYSEYPQDTGYLAMTEIVICVYPAA